MLNQARLKALKVREDHVRNVLDEARRRLGEVTRDQTKYSHILESLILQGLLQVCIVSTCSILLFLSQILLVYSRFTMLITSFIG